MVSVIVESLADTEVWDADEFREIRFRSRNIATDVFGSDETVRVVLAPYQDQTAPGEGS
ncbi:hypothetical protein nbrc107696_32920 [Gordonia spumicola]|uniref:Uncharacterized protein n=1 Tax=Gordonia spumicola TaxID=589161 RepID=A0A7I9VBU8_9ACTN|nr:hypothetical protein nbrc107696_32920 [Gordonia spumicola]